MVLVVVAVVLAVVVSPHLSQKISNAVGVHVPHLKGNNRLGDPSEHGDFKCLLFPGWVEGVRLDRGSGEFNPIQFGDHEGVAGIIGLKGLGSRFALDKKLGMYISCRSTHLRPIVSEEPKSRHMSISMWRKYLL